MNDTITTFEAATVIHGNETIQGSHLVRIEAGCEIREHTHPDNVELHEVVSGQGNALLGEQSIIKNRNHDSVSTETI